MKKLSIRLLMLSIFTTSLLVAPFAAQVSAAATSGKHTKKKVRVVQQSRKPANANANPFASKYDDDFDRKSAGGGGGY